MRSLPEELGTSGPQRDPVPGGESACVLRWGGGLGSEGEHIAEEGLLRASQRCPPPPQSTHTHATAFPGPSQPSGDQGQAPGCRHGTQGLCEGAKARATHRCQPLAPGPQVSPLREGGLCPRTLTALCPRTLTALCPPWSPDPSLGCILPCSVLPPL